MDLLVRRGTVIDGTGSDRFVADVAILGDRIVAVGDLPDATAHVEIDATGKIVAPGFIDVHNHSDGWLLREDNFAPKTTQGFTTEVLMADGIGYAPVNQHNVHDWLFYLRSLNGLRIDDYGDWTSFEQFMNAIDGQTTQNAASHLPYANVRALACGFPKEGVDDFQMREIRRQIEIGMEAGAVGVSTGLDYIVQCWSTTDELVEAVAAMAPHDGLYVTHVRYKKGLLPALREAVDIGRRAGVRVHISHLKSQSPSEVDQVLNYIDQTARHEVDFSFDTYPYQPGSTMLNFLLPPAAWQNGPLGVLEKLREPEIRTRFADGLSAMRMPLDRLRIAWVLSKDNSHLQGLTLAEYTAQSGLPAADALIALLIEERLAVLLVFDEGDDRLVHPFLQHDLFMLGTDGIYAPGGQVHPRVSGSVGRFLGPLVRDDKLFSLEQAIHSLTGRSADRFGFAERGRVAVGAYADLVIFDAETITDRATYTDPLLGTHGVETVIVNGTTIVANGEPLTVSSLPGRFVRKSA